MSVRHENVKWVDGLRGLASILVVFTHLTRAFDENAFKSIDFPGLTPRVIQWPFIRVLTQGRIGIAIFSLVTGYVCALKPIRLCRAGKPEEAFSSIAKSAFRRIPRLVIPASIATTIVWFFCQLGAFEIAHNAGGWWLDWTSPAVTPYLGTAVKDLIYRGLIQTWTNSSNGYEINQWTLLPLLKGSFLVYLMLVSTAYVKPRYRMMVEIALFLYYYISNDCLFGVLFFFGAFLCDLSQHPAHTNWLALHKWPQRFLSPTLIFFGLFLASYPEFDGELVGWSRGMYTMSFYIFPADAEVPRFYSVIGLIFIALGIHFSTITKDLLSNKYLLWLGKNSFAVYLLHGSFIRTLFVWMQFGIHLPPDNVDEQGVHTPGEKLQPGGRLLWYFWLPIWFVMLYTAANYWTRYVDTWCAKLTKRMEDYCFEDVHTGKPAVEKEHLSPLPR